MQARKLLRTPQSGHSRSLDCPLETASCPGPSPCTAGLELTVPQPSQPSVAAGQLHPPHPGPASLVDPVSPLPRHTSRCLRRWKGVPPPSCPLAPQHRLPVPLLGSVRVEATRAPRGHLPRPPCALRGGSQRPGGKGAGWGGAAAEDRAGQMAGGPRDASRSLAPPSRRFRAFRAGAAGFKPCA